MSDWVKIELLDQLNSLKEGDLLLEYPTPGAATERQSEITFKRFPLKTSNLCQVSYIFAGLNAVADDASYSTFIIQKVLPLDFKVSVLKSDTLLNGHWWVEQ